MGYAFGCIDKVSDVEAVRRWIKRSELDVAAALVPAYRDGRKVEVGSDFNSDYADTLQVTHELNLTDVEKQELWLLLDPTYRSTD